MAGDYGTVSQTSADMVTEHTVYHRDDSHAFWDTTDYPKEINSAFKVAREEPCSSKEEVSDRCGGKIESTRRACSFKYLEVQVKKCSPDELSLR